MASARPRALFGRQGDLAQLQGLLEGGASLITIHGPGGIGKTSLARQLAAAGWVGRRVCWVDLEAADRLEALIGATHRALTGVSSAAPEEPSDARLSQALAAAGDLLLVLDNLEQLLPAAAPLIAAWQEAAPELCLLVTSRETLRLSNEIVLELGPLDLEHAALELLIDRLRRVRPGWSPDPSEGEALAAIVEYVDGVPLAIELAAARARGLSLAALAEELGQDLSVLDQGPADAPARHRSIDASLAASFERLPERARQALWAAACFRRPFTAQELALVLGGGADWLREAQELLDRSLLAELSPGELTMLAPVQDFLRRHPPPEALGASLERAHGSLVLREARALGPDRAAAAPAPSVVRAPLRSPLAPRRPRALPREAGRAEPAQDHAVTDLVGLILRAETATDPAILEQSLAAAAQLSLRELALTSGSAIEAALERALARASELEPSLVSAALLSLADLAWFRGQHKDAERVADQALARPLLPADRALGLLIQARARFGLGQLEPALPPLEEAIALVDPLSDGRMLAELRQCFGAVRQSLGLRDEALWDLEAALEEARRVGARDVEAHVEGSLGVLLLDEGRVESARDRLQRGAALAKDTGQTRTREVLTFYLGLSALELGLLDPAEACFLEAQERAAWTLNGLHGAIYGLLLAVLMATRDELAAAEQGFAQAERALLGRAPWSEVGRVYRGHLHLARARAAQAAGRIADREEELCLAQGCLAIAGSRTAASSDDLRIAARILERALSSQAGLSAAPAPALSRGPPALLLGADSEWFSVAGAPRVDLSRRPLLRRLLSTLATQYERAPDEVVEPQTLIREAWPKEQYNAEVHSNRLHVALSSLRTLGLREVVIRSERGYRLQPGTELHRIGRSRPG